MKTDSHDFLVKTNKEVDEWMDSFYTDGKKADFRSHCQWAWQEQERRHTAIEGDLIDVIKSLVNQMRSPPTGASGYHEIDLSAAERAIEKYTGKPTTSAAFQQHSTFRPAKQH